MKHLIAIFSLFSCVLTAGAAWYWPFEGKEDKQNEPRLSELMEPATALIDSASDLADEGKVNEAVAEYYKALDELARIELENPERAAKPEFATVRNKRAYIESAIDSLLMRQAQRNAKAVAVTDTSDLERKFAEERAEREAAKANRGKTSSDRGRTPKPAAKAETAPVVPVKPSRATAAPAPADRRTRMLMAREALQRKDHTAALAILEKLLDEKPNDAPALNLRAMVEKDMDDMISAEETLTKLVETNPRVYYGYYNLAKLTLEIHGEGGKLLARRYYRTGRDLAGGPVDKFLEEKLK